MARHPGCLVNAMIFARPDTADSDALLGNVLPFVCTVYEHNYSLLLLQVTDTL